MNNLPVGPRVEDLFPTPQTPRKQYTGDTMTVESQEELLLFLCHNPTVIVEMSLEDDDITAVVRRTRQQAKSHRFETNRKKTSSYHDLMKLVRGGSVVHVNYHSQSCEFYYATNL